MKIPQCWFQSFLLYSDCIQCLDRSVCISRPPAFCLTPSPGSWAPICVYRSWPTILLLVRALSLHIPTLSPQFVFVFTVLTYDLYYRSGAWICIYIIIGSSSSGSRNSISSDFFGTSNTNICMLILVNQGKQTEACTHTGC